MLRVYVHAGRPAPLADNGQTESTSATDERGAAALRDGSADGERYRLVSIAATHPPDGCTGGNWFVYRIVQGKNGITGYRQGTLERVSTDVESIVTSLNGRRSWTKLTKHERRDAAAARRGAAK
jgi:hypothetical protein